MLVILVSFAFGFGLALARVGLPPLVPGFALAFSSTVFVVKVLEEKGDMTAFYGRIAIGILIMQDLFAFLFLSVSERKMPGVWALSVLALPLPRPLPAIRKRSRSSRPSGSVRPTTCMDRPEPGWYILPWKAVVWKNKASSLSPTE